MDRMTRGLLGGVVLLGVVLVAGGNCWAGRETVVQKYGLLKIVNGKLSSASGGAVQLKGMSLFWSQWSRNWYDAATVNNLADQWGCTVVRAAMGVESGGYLSRPEVEKARVRTVVDAAVAKGIYVLIDWHDHHAEKHLKESKAFFKEMATAYKNVPNVMFEVYNEPTGVPWMSVKSYAEAVIDEIRGVGAENVVIVGTPEWSLDVHKAAVDPIKKSNVAYTLHFYAGTHKENVRKQAVVAMSKGLALFVTECGTCAASGNGGLDEVEWEKWMKFLDEHQLSWANWSMNDKNETASAMRPGTAAKGPWRMGELTESGRLVVRHISEAGRAFVEGGKGAR